MISPESISKFDRQSKYNNIGASMSRKGSQDHRYEGQGDDDNVHEEHLVMSLNGPLMTKT